VKLHMQHVTVTHMHLSASCFGKVVN